MISGVFSIFDVKSDTFNVPFFMPTPGAAVRAFGDLVNDKDSRIAKHPEDYKLVKIGAFDDVTGVLLPDKEITSLGFGTDYVERGTPRLGAVPKAG